MYNAGDRTRFYFDEPKTCSGRLQLSPKKIGYYAASSPFFDLDLSPSSGPTGIAPGPCRFKNNTVGEDSMKITIKRLLATMFVAFLCFTTSAVANTPDGQTPAEETACDGLEGSMFGTCNAYCEAMDCDSPNQKASEKACQVKLKKWAAMAGEEPIPCEQDPGLTLSKSVNSDENGLIPVGEDVIYTFTIMNTGNVSLTGIQFNDWNLGVSNEACPEFDASQTLATNASITCTLDPVEAVEGLHTNTADASAETIYGLPVYAPQAAATYTGVANEVSCPCWTAEELNDMANGTNINEQCHRFDGPTSYGSLIRYWGSDSNGENRTRRSVEVRRDFFGDRCSYADYTIPIFPRLSRGMGITEEEFRSCDAQIRRAQEDSGRLNCVTL